VSKEHSRVGHFLLMYPIQRTIKHSYGMSVDNVATFSGEGTRSIETLRFGSGSAVWQWKLLRLLAKILGVDTPLFSM
jgi:hypothetical protein